MPVVLARVSGVNHPEATTALLREYPEYEEWLIDPADAYEYGRNLREAWDGESDLVVVEHDVVVPAGSIQGLLDCPFWWCAHPLDLGGPSSVRTLGLVKLAAGLQNWRPRLAALALPLAGEERRPVHWRSVDSALVRALEFSGLHVHIHQPPARHLHYEAEPVSGVRDSG